MEFLRGYRHSRLVQIHIWSSCSLINPYLRRTRVSDRSQSVLLRDLHERQLLLGVLLDKSVRTLVFHIAAQKRVLTGPSGVARSLRKLAEIDQ
jgi:hypothetical protein